MNFIELNITISADFADILVAELSEIKFSTFTETESGILAYCEADEYNESEVQSIIEKYIPQVSISYQSSVIAKSNWNEEWEKNFQPITIADTCLVRASFHKPEKNYKYDIVINPKMSFGTGHHQTTAMMLENQLAIDHSNKKVMDVGCGTAILSILAEKLGAAHVMAFDIDEWSVENGIENIQVNGCKNVDILQGEIKNLKISEKKNIILANINKNVLLNEIPIYASFLESSGYLIISGFYEKDVNDLKEVWDNSGLSQRSMLTKDNWVSVILQNSKQN